MKFFLTLFAGAVLASASVANAAGGSCTSGLRDGGIDACGFVGAAHAIGGSDTCGDIGGSIAGNGYVACHSYDRLSVTGKGNGYVLIDLLGDRRDRGSATGKGNGVFDPFLGWTKPSPGWKPSVMSIGSGRDKSPPRTFPIATGR